MIRIIDYYDLIELPDGSHIPVPMAIKMVGLKKVLEIPVAEKKRTSYFYWCEECHQDALYWGEDYEGSFFKCCLHNRDYYDPIRQKVKEITFKRLVESPKLIKLLKYIEIDENQRWRSVGSMKVLVVDAPHGGLAILEAKGRMVEIAEIERARSLLRFIKEFDELIEFYSGRKRKYLEALAESLSKFLPYKVWERFEWILDDVKVYYDRDREIDDPFQVCLEVTPRYELPPEEWYILFRDLVVFLYEVLPEEIANLVFVYLKTEPER